MLTNREYQARVRWHCRRGMLELDVLLLNFFDKQYQHMDKSDQLAFEKLLECGDQELFNWLVKQENPADSVLSNMATRIRAEAIT